MRIYPSENLATFGDVGDVGDVGDLWQYCQMNIATLFLGDVEFLTLFQSVVRIFCQGRQQL